jgi:threonyl-tRNA synthetase
MIHRAPFGSIERITAIILEHTCGNLPLWLAPEQIILLPISEKVLDYSMEIYDKFKKNNLRVTIDARNENLNRKIREAELIKIPLLAIIGEKEKKNNTLTIREHFSKKNIEYNIDSFMCEFKKNILN